VPVKNSNSFKSLTLITGYSNLNNASLISAYHFQALIDLRTTILQSAF